MNRLGTVRRGIEVKIGMTNMLEQAKAVQEQIEKAQAELAGVEVSGSAGGGMVVVTMNGKQRMLSIKLDEKVLKEDVELIEDLIVAAVNQALERASEKASEVMGRAAGGFLSNLPTGIRIPGTET